MEITRKTGTDGLELVVEGRIDAYWADHLTAALDEALRGGADRISLDLHGVAYLSSGGIRALLVAHRELRRVGGALRIVRPSSAVKSMLEMAGLLELLVLAPTEPKAVIASHGRQLERPEGSVESWTLERGAPVECRAIGDPSRLETGFDTSHCRSETFPADAFGFGLGAFGRDFEDCRGRFGELLAAGGAAVYLPTDGTNVPDFLIAGDGSAPEVRLLYGIRCAGPLSTHARFEAVVGKTFSLSALAEMAIDLLGTDRAGVIVVGEAAGLVGASLRRSPALAGEAPDFSFPDIRRWLSFTPDRAFPSSQALIVGVVSRGGAGVNGADPCLRPIGASGLTGHFHAAAFSHRPLPRGPLELKPTVAGLFEAEATRGLLH
ncbi:MAG TPA: STAS domain-containing protein, partial [Thermoanaerobaculia bacterium]|nr:STAS domain-containing protein [Thermoanaerobaculia bacterium]